MNRLTVRLLEARAGTLTTELLGLASAVVGNEEGSVELDKSLLEEVLGVLIDKLLVVGDQGLGNGLSDGIDLIHSQQIVYIDEIRAETWLVCPPPLTRQRMSTLANLSRPTTRRGS